MTSYEFLKILNEIITRLESNTELRGLLLKLSSSYFTVSNQIETLIKSQDTNSLNADSNKLIGLINSQIAAIKDSHSPKAIYAELNKFISAANDLAIFLYERNELSPLLLFVQEFENAYEAFVKYPNTGTTYDLIVRGRELDEEYLRAINLSIALNRLLEPEQVISYDESTLTILFYTKLDFSQLVRKLSALDTIYEELCILMNVSVSQFPLRIIKVESGSLWLKLFGESQVIKLMTDFLRSTANYAYNNFLTDEAKREEIRKDIELATSELILESLMRKEGIDTSEMRDNIRKASVIISKKSLTLVEGETKAEINGELFSVGDSYVQKFIDESKTRLLEEGDANDKKLLGDGRTENE